MTFNIVLVFENPVKTLLATNKGYGKGFFCAFIAFSTRLKTDNKSSITLLHCLKSVTNFVINATKDKTNNDFFTTDSFFISANIDCVKAIMSAFIISNNIFTKRAITLDAN